jgi:hypothetical protein
MQNRLIKWMAHYGRRWLELTQLHSRTSVWGLRKIKGYGRVWVLSCPSRLDRFVQTTARIVERPVQDQATTGSNYGNLAAKHLGR